VLLPSPQLAELAKRFSICLSGKTSPANCDIRYRQLYWLMVFDAKGELRSACRLGDKLTKVTKEGFDVPNAFVEIVEEAIEQPLSLEQLERDYVAARGSNESFDALLAKVEQLEGVGQMRVAKFLAAVKAETKDPVRSQARGLQVEAGACSHQVIAHAAFEHLREGVVEFVSAHPEHPAAVEMLKPLMEVGMKYSFDVAAKCRAYAQRWSRDGVAAHERLADLLLKQSDTLVRSAAKKLQSMQPRDYGYLRLQAVCGDAEGVLATMETTKTYGVFRPIHAEWREEAAAKKVRASDARK
jgi:hypothetical protein